VVAEVPVSGGRRRIAANSGWQLASFTARAVGMLGVVFIIARVGGPHSLGVFQFGITFTGLFPFYWGLPVLIAREVARRPEDARTWAECSIFVTLAIGAAFVGLFAVGTRVAGASPDIARSLVLAGTGLVIDSVARVQFAVFWAWERMSKETVATAVQEGAMLAAAGAVAAMGGGVTEVLYAFIATRTLGAAVAWAMLSRRIGHPVVPRTSASFAKRILRQATPFAANDTLTLVYGRADAVMLGMIKGPVAVGLYQAATNLVLNFNVLARSVNHAVYPRMSRAWTDAREKVGSLRDGSLKALSLIAVPVTIGSLLLAPEILRFLYGPRFDRAILTYRLLAVAIPVRMLGNTLSITLSAADQQTRRTVAVAVAAVANIGLNLYFIPRWSYVGAAITTLITEGGLFVAYMVLVSKVAGPSRLVKAIAPPTVACLPLVALTLAMVRMPMPTPVVAGVAGYGVGLLFVGALLTGRRVRDPRALVTALVRPGT
jgi:O-antigen/teichoic acid export membrane protein